MALTACLAAAFLALLVWAEQPSYRNSLLLGGATAMAVLSKFTALGFLPVAAVFALAVYWSPSGRVGKQTGGACQAAGRCRWRWRLLVGALVVWAGYLFSYGACRGGACVCPPPSFSMAIRRAMRHNAGEGGRLPVSASSARLVGGTSFPAALAGQDAPRIPGLAAGRGRLAGLYGPGMARVHPGVPGPYCLGRFSLESWRRP